MRFKSVYVHRKQITSDISWEAIPNWTIDPLQYRVYDWTTSRINCMFPRLDVKRWHHKSIKRLIYIGVFWEWILDLYTHLMEDRMEHHVFLKTLKAIKISCFCHINPNLTTDFTGLVGKVRKKLSPEGGRKGGWRKKARAPGPGARTRDLPRARRGSPAARHGSCWDKQAFPCL